MSEQVPTVPKALTTKRIWLLWKLMQREGEPKPRKVPFYANGAARAHAQGSAEDRDALVDFATAAERLRTGRYSGLGLAVLPGEGLVALDFDNCVKDGVIDPRVAALVADTYAEYSPSGNGLRAFMLGDMASRKDNADKADRNADGSRKDGQFDVEFFGDTGFVTITGRATEDCELMGLTDTLIPVTDKVRALYRERFQCDGALAVRQVGADDDLLSLGPPLLGWTLDQAREILFACDPSAAREKWLHALMAMHHEFGGSPEALDLCDEWSAQGASYVGRADVEGRWRSFGRSRSGSVTGRWLLNWRNECQAHAKYQAVTDRKSEIAAATDEFSLRERICPAIAKDDRIDDLGREALAQALLSAFVKLGSKYPIAQCRKLLAPRRDRKQDASSDLPEWLTGWVYVSDDDKFFRIDSDEWLSMQGFNARFNRCMQSDRDDDTPKSAAWSALEDWKIPTVTRARYLPWADTLFDLDGVAHVNSYRLSSVPSAVDTLSAAGKRAAEIVLRHVGLICGGREDVGRVLIDWMAHNVQKPGVKIRWAPLIKGVEGDGKSVLGTLLAAVMGRANVRNVSPKVLGTDFTGWAEGACVAVLEEIKLTGHNRYDILNALKPFLTNDSVEIHRKGKDPYDAINTTNYIAFTNHADALPLTDTDRRWLILFSPFTDRSGLAAIIRERSWGAGADDAVLGAYFETLNETINTCRAELRRWLLDWEISASFRPNGSAPMTAEKSVMIAMSLSDEEMSIKEALEKGGVGISEKVFVSSYLRNALVNSGAEVNLATSAWNHLLKRMGYTRVPRKVKWRGAAEIVWVKGSTNWEPAQIRADLDKTDVGGSEGSELDPLF